MSTFRNNLQKNDRVFDTKNSRQGKVKWTPKEGSRSTAIVYDGTQTPQYVDVLRLRLMPDGRIPEEHPPIEGTPPEESSKRSAAPVPGESAVSALDALKAERARNAAEMATIEQRFRALKAANEKLDRALTALSE